MASVKLYAHPKDTKADGTNQVYVQLIHEGNQTPIPTKIYVEHAAFNYDKMECTKHHPHYLTYNSKLSDKLNAAKLALLELADRDMSRTDLAKAIERYFKTGGMGISLEAVAKKIKTSMETSGRHGNGEALWNAARAFLKWKGDINMAQLTTSRLNDYKIHLIQKGLTHNTVSNYMRGLNTIYRYCESEGYVKRGNSPFRSGMVPQSIKSQRQIVAPQAAKVFLSKRHQLSGWEKMVCDATLLQFCFQGCSFSDIAQAPPLRDEYFRFRRYKSRNKLNQPMVVVKVISVARAIAAEYHHDRYLIPIYEGASTFVQQKAKQNKFNRTLNTLCKRFDIPKITSHTMRHTWITEATNLEIPVDTRKAAVGHVNRDIIEGYTQRSQELIDQANTKVLRKVLKKLKA